MMRNPMYLVFLSAISGSPDAAARPRPVGVRGYFGLPHSGAMTRFNSPGSSPMTSAMFFTTGSSEP
jgi:hypothetical protein